MSALQGKAEGLGLQWIRPRGVAPERMPKAEATTELAPKKASAPDPLLAATKSLSEGFGFGRPNFFGEAFEELRPWAIKRERSPGRFCPVLLLVLVRCR
jgi:hypothetical protein